MVDSNSTVFIITLNVQLIGSVCYSSKIKKQDQIMFYLQDTHRKREVKRKLMKEDMQMVRRRMEWLTQ